MGKCPDCGAWDALEKFVEAPPLEDGGVVGSGARNGAPAPAHALAGVKPTGVPRAPTGVRELDRVLGGGFVAGSVVLIGGDPGIGKSTLLLQSAAALASAGGKILYATSEESAAQVKLRAQRLHRSDDAQCGRNL